MLHLFDISKKDVWDGARVATLAHALWTIEDPSLANEHRWDGPIYHVSDTQGAFGSVSFLQDGFVGTFFDARSEIRYKGTEIKDLFHDALLEYSVAQMDLLPFMLQREGDLDEAIVATACWSQGGQLVAPVSWEQFLNRGGKLLEFQLRPVPEALKRWSDHYALSKDQSKLLAVIADIRTRNDGWIEIPALDLKPFCDAGMSGLAEAEILLEEVQIRIT